MAELFLLTGATGFVGRQVLRVLADRGVQVRVVIRKNSQTNLESSIQPERIVQTADLFAENASWWEDVCEGVDTIIHCAWYAEPGKYLQATRNIDCLTGTLELARGAAAAGVKRFVGIGTCFEYDLTGGVLSTETRLNPLTQYAASKVSAYLLLKTFFPLKKVSFAWCRLFYLYGEGEDVRRFVPYLRSCLSEGKNAELTSGNQIRDYLEVGAAASGIVDVAQSGIEGAANICSGIPVTIRQFAEKIAEEYGRIDLLKFGVRPDNIVDPVCVVGIKTQVE